MQELIKAIRTEAGFSQTEFGEEIGVSFSTVNRWENGKAYPNAIAQKSVYDFAKSHSVDVLGIIYDRIKREAEEIQIEESRILLYHGSKSGVEGDIKPVSRSRCDFGKGFYMGTVPEQALTLICDYDDSKLYMVSLDINELSTVEMDNDLDWAMYVALNRGKMTEEKHREYYEKYFEKVINADIVIGDIANDRIFFVLDNFFQGVITDKALISSLSALRLGKQYVAATNNACEKVRIEKEIKLSLLERMCLQGAAEENRLLGINRANEICKKFRREGLYFDEILDNAEGGC